VATPGGAGSASAGSSGGGSQCWSVPLDAEGVALADTVQGRPPGDGFWSMQFCDGRSVGWQWNAGGAPMIPASVLGQRAAADLAVPGCEIGTSPRADYLIVRFETWLWVACAWAQVSATANVPGLSATATASPREVVWEMGDGSTVACDNPGTPWNPALSAEQQRPSCSYTYRTSSAGQPGNAYVVTATVRWAVSWSASDGEGGTLPGVSRSSSLPVQVGEVQAVITR
jgi:hypothetical protein